MYFALFLSPFMQMMQAANFFSWIGSTWKTLYELMCCKCSHDIQFHCAFDSIVFFSPGAVIAQLRKSTNNWWICWWSTIREFNSDQKTRLDVHLIFSCKKLLYESTKVRPTIKNINWVLFSNFRSVLRDAAVGDDLQKITISFRECFVCGM